MNVINFKEGSYPIIIKPNMGQPILINLRDFKGNDGEYFKKVGEVKTSPTFLGLDSSAADIGTKPPQNDGWRGCSQ